MKTIKSGIILLFILLTGNGFLFAQSGNEADEPARTILRFTCINTSDDSIQLKSTLTVRRDEGSMNLANAVVQYFAVGSEEDVLISEVKTNYQGIASIKIPALNTYPRGEMDLFNFKAVYEGAEKYESSESEFSLKPARLKVSFYEEDSVRFVKVEGTQLNLDGTETPLAETDVNILVPKMFSMLKIAEVYLDETGSGSTEFPVDIIGDSLGNLTVVASIEENDIFGNVKASADNNWGLQKHLISPDRPSRELWTPIAPLWMIITLIIMLAGVWGHYVYAVVQLFRIRKSAKADENKS